MTPKRTTWRTDLRQLIVYKQFRWINIRAVTFSFVDKSSSRGLKKFGENIQTNPEVIGAHTQNFNSNFNFSSTFGGGDPRPSSGVR